MPSFRKIVDCQPQITEAVAQLITAYLSVHGNCKKRAAAYEAFEVAVARVREVFTSTEREIRLIPTLAEPRQVLPYMTTEDLTWCLSVLVAGSHPAKFNTWELTQRILDDRVPGDFAECGVYLGGHPIIMDRVLRRNGDVARVIHLFDSFQGIPRASLNDAECEQQALGLRTRPDELLSSGVSAASIDVVRGVMHLSGANLDRMRFHPGWFEETLPAAAKEVGSLAMLRIDVDLYTSISAVLWALYDKVVSGGIIVDDDYGEREEVISPPRRALLEFFDARGLPRPEVTRVTDNPGTAWWRKP